LTDAPRQQDLRPPTRAAHPQYGTCSYCHRLKHVAPDGLVRLHNRYEAHGTVVTTLRCAGSGAPYAEIPQQRPA
jgi:hypothetical protein